MSEWTADLRQLETRIKAWIESLREDHHKEILIVKSQLTENTIATDNLRKSVDSIKEQVQKLTVDFTSFFEMRNQFYKDKSDEDAEARAVLKTEASRKLKQEEDDRAIRIQRENDEWEDKKKQRAERKWLFRFAVLGTILTTTGAVGGFLLWYYFHVQVNVKP